MAHSTQSLAESWTQSRLGVSTKELSRSSATPVLLPQDQEDAAVLLALAADAREESTDPRAEGACLFDLSPQEWRFVRNAPLVGFLMVAGADGTVLPRERRALVSALEKGKRSSSELFQAVCRELYSRRDTLVEVFVSDTFEREQLIEAYRLVSDKLGSDEAERFKACLLKLGRQVAKASGGVLAACGWLRGVEQRALAELATALGPRR